MRNCFKYLLFLIISTSVLGLATKLNGQSDDAPRKALPLDSIPVAEVQKVVDSLVIPDSLLVKADSLSAMVDSLSMAADSLLSAADTIIQKKKESSLNDVVTYKTKDSLIFHGNNTAVMYGASTVNYKEIQLDADYIVMDLDSSNVYARGGEPDSTGVVQGKPKFKDNGGEYDSETMKYNFNSSKGYITNVITQQGEGYVTGGQTKKLANNDLYMQGGRYTTCDEHEHPHFYFALTRAKITPGSNIVTGPAYLVLEDVPLPLAVPFGFFPFNESYSSGIIFPQFGEEMNRGFFLRNGGYYFAINDNVDLALTGEIYTKGSWGINAQSAYLKKYKYSGSFNLGYLTTVMGDKGMADYSKTTDFKLIWSHTKDPKSSPNSTFSANVNLSTSTYDRKQMDSYYNPNNFTNNTKSSSINYTYKFPTIPLNIASNFNINQRTKDSAVAVTLPDVTITLSRIAPFKRKTMVGSERWYEKIYVNYTGQLRNSIDTKEDKLLKSSLLKDWKNGMQHNIPVSATFSLFKNISITPSFNYTERWYKDKIMRSWDPLGSVEARDTVLGFNRVYNYSANIGLSTKLYGFYKPWKIFGDKVQMIRHVFTPSVTVSAAPDFGDPKYGFWSNYSYEDNTGKTITRDYSPYESALFGTAPRGKQGLVTLSLQNNLEMKLGSKSDTAEAKKISLIDNFTAGVSYNAAADSMNWSNITTSLRLKLTEQFSLNVNGTFDTYTYKASSSGSPIRVNVTQLERFGRLGKLSSASTSFAYNINNDTFKKKEDRKNNQNRDDQYGDEFDEFGDNELDSAYIDKPKVDSELGGSKEKPKDTGPYEKLMIQWGLGFNYSLNYTYGDFDPVKEEHKMKLSHNLSFNGNINLTKNWTFSFNSGWDFDQKKLTMMTCNLSRKLHCWTITASFIPIGPYQSYFFTIAVNSSLLKDFKWDKRSTYYDSNTWY